MEVEGAPPVRPEQVLRPGRSDAVTVLGLWCLHRCFWPFLWLGLLGAALAGRTEDVGTRFDSVDSVLTALWSPLVGLVLALGARMVSGAAGFAAAYPLAHVHGGDRAGRSGTAAWVDRFYRARGYRALRWTGDVRALAVVRAGTAGRRLDHAQRILQVANPVLLATAVLTIVLTAP